MIGDILTCSLASLVGFGIGHWRGWVLARDTFEQCNRCGSAKYPRRYSSLLEIRQCVDFDGCTSREKGRQARK